MRALMLLLLASALGCTPKVGDECTSNTDCGQELECDRAQPSGYCTQTPCEVNGCPTEAACIRFDDESTWCMLRCKSNGDCRDGYVCEKAFGDTPFCVSVHYTPPEPQTTP